MGLGGGEEFPGDIIRIFEVKRKVHGLSQDIWDPIHLPPFRCLSSIIIFVLGGVWHFLGCCCCFRLFCACSDPLFTFPPPAHSHSRGLKNNKQGAAALFLFNYPRNANRLDAVVVVTRLLLDMWYQESNCGRGRTL